MAPLGGSIETNPQGAFKICLMVPLKGGRWHIIPSLAVYTTYILPSGGLYATYHLLGEPETTIDMCHGQKSRFFGDGRPPTLHP